MHVLHILVEYVMISILYTKLQPSFDLYLYQKSYDKEERRNSAWLECIFFIVMHDYYIIYNLYIYISCNTSVSCFVRPNVYYIAADKNTGACYDSFSTINTQHIVYIVHIFK